jgi:hypothetical protein
MDLSACGTQVVTDVTIHLQNTDVTRTFPVMSDAFYDVFTRIKPDNTNVYTREFESEDIGNLIGREKYCRKP